MGVSVPLPLRRREELARPSSDDDSGVGFRRIRRFLRRRRRTGNLPGRNGWCLIGVLCSSALLLLLLLLLLLPLYHLGAGAGSGCREDAPAALVADAASRCAGTDTSARGISWLLLFPCRSDGAEWSTTAPSGATCIRWYRRVGMMATMHACACYYEERPCMHARKDGSFSGDHAAFRKAPAQPSTTNN